MECAGRALSFWAYQITQKISYQHFLYKTLVEKYSTLRAQMDQIASEANSEIERLRQRLTSAAEQSIIRRKNEELAQAYKQKSRKLLQTLELYNRLKRKEEIGRIRRAASNAVESTYRTTNPIRTLPSGCNISDYA
ncbi:hypothetical protein L249_7083 [Ophiocordyceps polyrhachis-furcata BCC 54312]|uniref:Uncharacterized protein n=1 Tax=Ophiocordyceps polyrhachis-furcata BCC 54312 TaxID=1330021 RepID=A0A367LJW7_9HYPO|nr:hypothetical protein L249_7083 [Ophiocordyceps polyrhachis-furcata BCC 54312]